MSLRPLYGRVIVILCASASENIFVIYTVKEVIIQVRCVCSFLPMSLQTKCLVSLLLYEIMLYV